MGRSDAMTAFAPVVPAWAHDTGADLAKTNFNGGAIAGRYGLQTKREDYGVAAVVGALPAARMKPSVKTSHTVSMSGRSIPGRCAVFGRSSI